MRFVNKLIICVAVFYCSLFSIIAYNNFSVLRTRTIDFTTDYPKLSRFYGADLNIDSEGSQILVGAIDGSDFDLDNEYPGKKDRLNYKENIYKPLIVCII